MANTSLNFGTGNDDTSDRRYTFPCPNFPNSDWAVAFWFRHENAWTDRDFVLSMGGAGENNSFQLSVQSENSVFWSLASDGTGPGIQVFGGEILEDVDYLFVTQRRGANIEVYVVAKESTASGVTFSVAHAYTAGITGDVCHIGASSSLSGTSRFQNPLGEVSIVTTGSLTLAQVNTLAAGAHITEVATPVVDLRLRESNATETNLGSGGATHNATRFGTGWTTSTEFFPDLAPTLTDGPDVTDISVDGFDIGGTADQNCTVELVVVNYGDPAPEAEDYDASTETTSAIADTPFSIHHTGQ